MTLKLLDWLRHTLPLLSERKLEEELDETLKGNVDFDAMCNPEHPKCLEMRRRYRAQTFHDEPTD